MKDQAMWVFGYASLIWNPGFDYEEKAIARLKDYARSFCMRSIHHRGTPQDPGLVLALDAHPGAACEGVAFRVARSHEASVLTYLRERELISSAYLERHLPLRLEDGRNIEALAYVVDPDHAQYCGGLALEEQARIIATAKGGRGPNNEYLFNTVAHLDALDIADEELSWLARRVRAVSA
ncbi:MAG: gamma-glutamylcyclotransferase [Pseudomonadota bacterium]